MKNKLPSPLSCLNTLPNTVEGCHHLLTELVFRVENIEKENIALKEENAALKARLNTHSQNSSLPPSKDPAKKPKKMKRPSSGRPSGGQAGHPGHFRKLLDSAEVDSIVNCPLPEHCHCGGELVRSESYARHQVYELPPMKLQVTEYQLAKGYCAHCRQRHTANLPEGVTHGITGPRLTAYISHLVAKYQLSRREVQGFLKEQYDFAISLGTVFNKQREMNAVLAGPVAELRVEAAQSPYLHLDETGHRRDGKTQWLWAAVSAKLAIFSVEASRNKSVLQRFLGGFNQIIISDRYAVYNSVETSRRQLCWAHLKRDFARLMENAHPQVARLGILLSACTSYLFHLWHGFKRGELDRAALIERTEAICLTVEHALLWGLGTDPSLRVARFCENLWDRQEALWTFLFVEGIEPTNNLAERCLRPAVLWRKRYFGTRSEGGSTFVAQTASVLMTCALQSKNAFEYFCQATHHYFAKTTAPPLLSSSVS